MNRLDEPRARALKAWERRQQSRRPVIYIGAASCGLAAGAAEVKTAIQAALRSGKHKADIVEVGCIGPCYLEPLVDVQMPGKPRICYSNVTPDLVPGLVDSFFVRGEV